MRTKIRRKETAHGVRWYVSTIDDDGREEAHGGHAKRTGATAAAAALVTDAARGRYVSPAKLTLSDYLLDEWLPSRETADLSETTRDTDRTVAEAWVIPWIGQVPLQKLSARDLDRLYRELRRAAAGAGARSVASRPATPTSPCTRRSTMR